MTLHLDRSAANGSRRLLALLGSGTLLGAALLLTAGCGTGKAIATNSPPAASSSAATTADPTATKTPAAATTTTAPSTTGTAATGDQPIPKTGTNPVVPIAGGALAVVGAAALLGGWRRLRGATR